MNRLLTVAIRNEDHVLGVRQRARQIAEILGFDRQNQVRIATAVSELARNVLLYAGSGKAEFAVDDAAPRPSLAIRIDDDGPGIADLDSILAGTYRSRTGLGLGLIGAQRLMDEFAIESSPGEGTTVSMAKRLPDGRVVDDAIIARLLDALVITAPASPLQEMQLQNQDLVRTLEELRQRQDELVRLNRELEDTNRGVVALYAELDEKAESLRRADDSKTRFLSDMGHEFRTPLNSIRGLSRLLLDRVDGPLTEEQDKQVRLIRKAAEDLSTMVDDLLDLAKIEAGRVDVRCTEFTVAELFSALRGMLRPLLVTDSVRLIFEAADDSRLLSTDEAKLSQILRNLISNALKYTERGEVRVSAQSSQGGNSVRFAVADTGIGIAPEDHARIFDEFTQVENRLQKRVKGTGLGLPLCRKLAALLRGRIEMESAPGVGSTFAVVIPARWSEEVEAATPRADAATHDGAEPSVLVVDDEEAARYLMMKLLAGFPVRVQQATDGASGVDFARRIRPQLIFLDIRMPNWNGAEVLSRLKADPTTADIPVIMVSSSAIDELERPQFAEATAVLRKDQLSADQLYDILSAAKVL